MTDRYDAGLLNDFGGGNVEWWQDYLRAEIERANDFHADLVAELAAENERLTELIRWAHDTLYEINPSNYDHDEVCKLNDASVEVILGLAPSLGETHGKSKEWWSARAKSLSSTGAVKEAGAKLAKAVFGVDLVAHPRTTNTVVSHETANVVDKPEGQQEQVANEPVTHHWPEAYEVADILAENKGFWRACSGCHESNEGHPTGPWSMILGCNLGHGCHECGGIGAIWDTTDYADMGDYLAQEFTRPSEQAVTEAGERAAEQVMTAHYERPLKAWELTALHEALKAAMEAGRHD